MRIILIICSLISVNFAENEPKKIKRFFHINSGYNEPEFNSNEGMKLLPLSTMQLYSKIHDFTNDLIPHWGTRVSLLLVDYMAHNPIPFPHKGANNHWLTRKAFWPGKMAYHEFGHARESRMTGGEPRYTGKFYGGSEFNVSSAIDYYVQSITHFSLYKGGATSGGNTILPVINAAGGFNNETRLSQDIASLIYTKGGHVGYFTSYITYKLNAATYTMRAENTVKHGEASSVGGDPGSVISQYSNKIDAKTLKRDGFLTFLASGATWAFVKGWWDYIQTGNPMVEPFTWKNIRWPDFNVYYNTNGPSLEILSGYQYSESLFFDLAFEFVYKVIRTETKIADKDKYKVNATWQITPSARYVYHGCPNVGEITVEGSAMISQSGFGASIGLEIESNQLPISFHAKYTLYNLNTLYGERNMPFFYKEDPKDKSNFDNEILVGISANY